MTINLRLILNYLIKSIQGYWSLNISYFSFCHIITMLLTKGKRMHGWIGCLSRKLLLCYKIKICLAAASVLSRILPFPIYYKTEDEIRWRIFLISRAYFCIFNFILSYSRRQETQWEGNERKQKDNNKTPCVCLSLRDLKQTVCSCESEILVAWRSFWSWTKQDPLAHSRLNGLPSGSGSLGGCKRGEKKRKFVWLTPQGKLLSMGWEQ